MSNLQGLENSQEIATGMINLLERIDYELDCYCRQKSCHMCPLGSVNEDSAGCVTDEIRNSVLILLRSLNVAIQQEVESCLEVKV